MCVFFIFFTPVEPNSKCIFHPHHPPSSPHTSPHKKNSAIEKPHVHFITYK